MTRGPVVGSVRSHFFEDLYEQCSFHIAEKMPSSVSVGSRPISVEDALVFVGLQPVRGDELGRDRIRCARRVPTRSPRRWSRGFLPVGFVIGPQQGIHARSGDLGPVAQASSAPS